MIKSGFGMEYDDFVNEIFKLRILKYPIQDDKDLKEYYDAVKDLSFKIFKLAVAEAKKTLVEFPTPAEIRRIYYTIIRDYGYKFCKNCKDYYENNHDCFVYEGLMLIRELNPRLWEKIKNTKKVKEVIKRFGGKDEMSSL